MHSTLKDRMKKALRLVLGTKPANIPFLLQKADIVSFDLFDTLVRRDVPSPEGVHNLVERAFFHRTGRTVPDYGRKRKQAERAAYAGAGDREITLQEIFDKMESVNQEDRERLMDLEQEVESSVCCADPDMKEVYEQALKTGKRVVITSDMYLPENTIRSILDRCGYRRDEKLYLSSSYGATKASGKLYLHVCEKEGHPQTIVHIGDNIKSDYLRAGQAGFKPVLLSPPQDPLRFHTVRECSSFASACFYAFLKNHKPRGKENRDELAVSLGYEVLGPLLGGYCRWLQYQMEQNHIQKIFFLSREGKLLQRAYEELYPERKGSTSYLYVSRQALQVPVLGFCRSFHDMCRQVKPLMREHTLKAIGEICHLGYTYEKRLAMLSLKPEDDLFRIPEAVQGPYFDLVQELGRDYFTKQYSLAKDYLSQEGVEGAVILSDIGWHGTMQQAIDGYCQGNAHLLGCYIGCWDPASSEVYAQLSRKGYLTAPGKNKDMELLLRFSCDIVETLLSSSEGSVMAYGKAEGRIVPVLQENELDGSSREWVRQVQQSAMDFLRDLKNGVYAQADIPEELVFAGLQHVLQNPSACVVDCFKHCRFLDGTLRSMLPEHSFGWYVFHPGMLVSDFEKSSCKLFFLKDVFKVPLPWFQLLKFLRENLQIKSSNQKIWLEQ